MDNCDKIKSMSWLTKFFQRVVLLVSYFQYATADPLFDQDAKKSNWISVIRNRKSVDSFPHHNAIVNHLEHCGYIGEGIIELI